MADGFDILPAPEGVTTQGEPQVLPAAPAMPQPGIIPAPEGVLAQGEPQVGTALPSGPWAEPELAFRGQDTLVRPTGPTIEPGRKPFSVEPFQVVPPEKPWGWAKQDAKGRLLYVTPEGEQRWVEPKDVQTAAKQGMMPVSESGEKDLERRKFLESAGHAYATAAISGLTGGLLRMKMRELGTMTAREQAIMAEESPLATILGEATGVGASLLMPGGVLREVGAGAQAAARLPAATAAAFPRAAALVPSATRVAAEGATIGLGGGISSLAMKPGEIEPGEAAKELAKHVGVGVALNSLFAVGGAVVGKVASKAWGKFGPKGLLEKAGTNERQVAAAMEDMRNTAKALKSTDETTASVPGAVSIWTRMRDAVDSGEWAQTTKAYTRDSAAAAVDKLGRRIESLENAIKNAKAPGSNIGPEAISDMEGSLSVVRQKHMDAAKAVDLLWTDKLLANDLLAANKALSGYSRTPAYAREFSPAQVYADSITASAAVSKLGERIGQAMPFSGTLLKSLGSMAFGGIAGYAWTQDWKWALAGAALPYAVRKGIMATAGREIIPQALKDSLSAAAAPIPAALRSALTSGVSTAIPMLSDDEKEKELERAKLMADRAAANALANGMVRAGMDQAMAKAVADGRVSMAEFILANATANRVRFSKLLAATDPRAVMARIASDKATKEDYEALAKLSPKQAVALGNMAKTLISTGKSSELRSKPYRFLGKIMKNVSMATIMAQSRTPKAPGASESVMRAMAPVTKPKGFSPAGLRGGSRGFGSMATAGQSGEARMR